MKPKISVVVPVYNEDKNISLLYKRLTTTLKNISSEYEIIFINDGSTDSTQETIQRLHSKDRKVRYISFSRNFGHMPAVNAGLTYSSGEKVVIMDADLQDPPEVIAKMYDKSLQGFDVVYGIKKKRKENWSKRLAFNGFYVIFNRVSALKMPLNAGTFSLLDKKVVDILNALPEKNKYFSGLRFWTGFSQTGIEYERSARYSGKPSSLRKLIKLALDGIVSFSHIPLRIASILGFVFAAIAFVFIVFVLISRFVFGFGIIGWASTMSAILLIGGIQLITLGIIGEYLARIYDEVKKRPEYIISQKIGFNK